MSKPSHDCCDLMHFMEPHDATDGIDYPVTDMNLIDETTEAVHEMEEGELEEDEDDDDEENQIYHTTYSNQHASEQQYPEQSRGSVSLSTDIRKSLAQLTLDYSQISKQQFKILLYQANPSCRQQLQQYLSNPKLLSYVQKYTHLMSMRFQLEMQKDYWEHVSDGLLSAIQWLSQMPKNLTRRYSINWTYPRTERNLRHKQRLVEQKLNRIGQKVQVHSHKYFSCWTTSDKALIDQTTHIISDTLKIMLEDDLQYLHIRYEQKKILIQYDAYDVYVLKTFFDVYPTEDQKTNVQKIWRTQRQCCKRQIHRMKTTLLTKQQTDTSTIYNENNQSNIDPYHQQCLTSILNTFNPIMRYIIESRQGNIEKRTRQIIAFQNTSLIVNIDTLKLKLFISLSFFFLLHI